MKLIKKYAGFLLMLTLLVGFTSCELYLDGEFFGYIELRMQ